MVPTGGMVFIFLLVGVIIILFVTQAIPMAATAVGVIVVLIIAEPLTGVDVATGLSGFANPATVTIAALMILSEGVRRTGVLDRLTRSLARRSSDEGRTDLLATVGVVGPLSAVINNTAAVAIMLPAIVDLAERIGRPPSKLLLPLSYASMAGGMLTLVGTSTNLLASAIIEVRIGRPFGMFEFTGLGLIVLGTTLIYLMVAADRLTPASSPETVSVGDRLFAVRLHIDDPDDIGTPDRLLRALGGRGDVRVPDGSPLPGSLICELPAAGIRAAYAHPDISLGIDDAPLGDSPVLLSVVVTPGALRPLDPTAVDSFEAHYGVRILGLNHDGRDGTDISTDRLHPGDLVLLITTEQRRGTFAADPSLIITAEYTIEDVPPWHLPVVGLTLAGAITVAAVGLAPIAVTALAGVVVLIGSGVLRVPDAITAVRWDVIVLLAGLIPLGAALSHTGGDAFLASLIVDAAPDLPLVVVLGLVYVVTALVTNLISNQASVVLLIPVALQVARSVGADPIAFALAVTFAASTAFMTPVGYQTNLFVLGPGGYDYRDYLRLGGPLQVLLAVITPLSIAMIWGF
jgi:Di- and tricarboxylate transporters